ncbi:WD-40 repeat-containing protein [Rhizopus microsporus var. microsporus]|uniref:WD-40 repeat-containing protein n=1 Tax=Rhizopus microsporus var. microsporus TaxID=86635 RepID=A0A1X0R1X0_RHIZD|nr:WD-40 repeat-containing protein [Rhizopus microsporus var. microsporus]
MSTSNDDDQQKKIMEEYAEWKKSAHLLYDMIISHNLTWPSLTLQWLPKKTFDNGWWSQEMLIGTHTNDLEPNFAQLLRLDIPEKKSDKTKFSISQRVCHEGEVNRARYMPLDPSVFATKTVTGDVLVFDRKVNHSQAICDPLLKLKGHCMEGYGLAWCHHESKKNHLLSAGFDQLICHWDIGMTPNQDKELEPLQVYRGHTSCVEDVSWNATNDCIFASVADDKKLMIWDTRSPGQPAQSVQAHTTDINSVAFHPKQDWMLATGSSDKTIGLFDIRKIDDKLYSFESHEGEVLQVAWSPHEDPILASAASDRKIIVWDLREIGKEQTPDDAEDGPPEVLFVHSGHTAKINDFSWNPEEPWVISSCAEDNVVQIWKVSKRVYTNTKDLEINPDELE